MNPEIFLCCLPTPERLASSLRQAMRQSALSVMVHQRHEWVAGPRRTASSTGGVDLVFDLPPLGDFPMVLQVVCEPGVGGLTASRRSFYRLVDAWSRELACPLVVLDGPSYVVGKRFRGTGSWEWVMFDEQQIYSEPETFALAENGRDGVVGDDEVASIAARVGFRLRPEDLDHAI